MKRHFPKENIKLANRYRKQCLASLTMREMQTKTTRYHVISVSMAFIKKQEIISFCNDSEKRKHLCTVGGDVN